MTSTDHDTEPSATPALDAWLDAHPRPRTDTANIRLWMPEQAPHARPDTVSAGCAPDRLTNPDRPIVNVQLGPVTVAGFGDELEQYFTAALELVQIARRSARRINANNEETQHDD